VNLNARSSVEENPLSETALHETQAKTSQTLVTVISASLQQMAIYSVIIAYNECRVTAYQNEAIRVLISDAQNYAQLLAPLDAARRNKLTSLFSFTTVAVPVELRAYQCHHDWPDTTDLPPVVLLCHAPLKTLLEPTLNRLPL
jgi:hypothetical protein